MKNPYFPTALGLYFNYGAWYGRPFDEPEYGSLETLWQTNAAGVSIVISSLGIGRLSVLLLQDYYPIALVAALLSCSGCAAIWPSFWHPADQ